MTAFSQHFKMSQQHYRTLSRLSVVVASGVVVLLCNRIVGLFDSPHTWAGMSPNGQSHTARGLKWIGEDPLLKPHNLRDDSNVECRDFHTMPNVTDICKFVNATDDCQIGEGFIDYTVFVYCTLGNLVPLALVILFMWWLFLFICLAVTADDFFCPSLTVISKTLRLSHNVAGVTFLAFGNGAPDIFSAIAAIGSAKNGDAGMAVGALFGAGVFVTTVVAGVIAVVCPFDAMQRPFLRDVIFYLAAAFWTFYILWKKTITKFEALGFIGLYVFYVLVVVIGRYIYQRERQRPEEQTIIVAPPSEKYTGDLGDSEDGPLRSALSDNGADGTNSSPNPYNIQEELLQATVSIDTRASALERSPLLEHAQVENYTLPKKSSSEGEDNSTFMEFLEAVNPIDIENWPDKRFYSKGYEIFKCPILLLLKLTIPVVDYDCGDDNHNWNRHLNSLHCLTGPVFGVLATKVGFMKLGGVFPMWGLVMVVGAVLSLTVFCVTGNDNKPRFHAVFAYLGFVVAVVWIYSVANEIVNILQTFGIVFNISNAILGLTFLAWGNSVGDLIADFAMARQGYPRMGISACFGGPLFNMLLGIGIPFTIGTFKRGGNYELRLTLVELILAGFLCLSLVSSLIIVPLSKFRMSRPYGIFLFILYGVFIVVAMLAETNVIHANV
ncbi:mitochondrial sodium/calcium exchanger protein-like isoform X2 [Haliotis rufescens]|uniref:mitochondrial sodium/calcium exchanger protein-like isoform X2 n=1 Tax=Haliotis rufescens TaxID=6454 RepID=UPI00201ED9E4|nr:mitochondrial sodium/calcium exchanger protein-like isoform X2 [Haliotis rufescens]